MSMFIDDSNFSLEMKIKKLMPMDVRIDAESRRLIYWTNKGVYNAFQNRYMKKRLFYIGDSEGPMNNEYYFYFNTGNINDEVSMNVSHCRKRKKSTTLKSDSRRLIDSMEKGVYDAFQNRYTKKRLFYIGDLEGPMNDEYFWNTKDEEGSLNFSQCRKRKNEATLKSNARSSTLKSIDRSSACEMVRTLVQLLRTLNQMPEEVCLGFHDAGTYDKNIRTWTTCGRANEILRLELELKHATNAGLINVLKLLQPIKDKYPGIAYADLFQLARATAVEEAGGHKIPLKYEEFMCLDPSSAQEKGSCVMMYPQYLLVVYQKYFTEWDLAIRSIPEQSGRGKPEIMDTPIISLQSGLSGKDGQILTKASGGGSDNHSTQEVSVRTDMYELNHIKGTTVLIRRYDRGWLIMCDSRVSCIDDNNIFHLEIDAKLKCTLAAHLKHVTVSCGMVEISSVIQAKVRGYICSNSDATLSQIWLAVENQIRDRMSQKFPTANRYKKVESAKLMVVSRANLKYFMVIIAKRKIGELIFDVKVRMMTECTFGSGSDKIEPITVPWPKPFRNLDVARDLLWDLISKASLLDRCTGGYGCCFSGEEDIEWNCHSCMELPDDASLYGPGDDNPITMKTKGI